MSKSEVHVQEPSEEMKQKIIRARIAISTVNPNKTIENTKAIIKGKNNI